MIFWKISRDPGEYFSIYQKFLSVPHPCKGSYPGLSWFRFMTWGHFCPPNLFNVTKAQVGYGLKYHQQTC